jgi:dihydrolipoamide dehydrogenase
MKPIKAELVVLGGGPGGYAAAFYAADKGKQVILVEQERRLGGVCLNRGCIPSKALLHATELIRQTRHSGNLGITFDAPAINLEQVRKWKDGILDRLSGGIGQLGKARNVQVLAGRGHFEGGRMLRVETQEGQKFVEYDTAIIAVGSKPAIPKAFDLGNERVMSSTEALELEDIPKDFLVVGGGYIGLELGTVYASLGSSVVLVEAMPSLLPGVDPDLVQPVMRYAKENFREVRLNAKVLKMETAKKQIKVTFELEGAEKDELYDRVLVAVGRVPNCNDLGLENTQVKTSEKGFIEVDKALKTRDPHIYAIGDVIGGAMLAHKAAKEARIAVDNIVGEAGIFDSVIPAVVFTDPEIAWCGLTANEAKEKGLTIKTVRFPWAASGRAMTLDRVDGITKLVIDPDSERVLGVGIAGHGAGELISEGVLAIEMGATARDLAESIHPHPTLSETLMECAEVFYGQATHTVAPKRNTPPE